MLIWTASERLVQIGRCFGHLPIACGWVVFRLRPDQQMIWASADLAWARRLLADQQMLWASADLGSPRWLPSFGACSLGGPQVPGCGSARLRCCLQATCVGAGSLRACACVRACVRACALACVRSLCVRSRRRQGLARCTHPRGPRPPRGPRQPPPVLEPLSGTIY